MNEVNQAGGAHGGAGNNNIVDDAIGQAERSGEEYRELTQNAEDSGSNDMAYYLKLQRAMMQEQQAYTAVSTILKARSDASLTAIRNFK
jgi:hypothetical protein